MSYNRRIEVEFVGQASGFSATLNRINGGLRQLNQGFGQTSKGGGVLANQIKAIGTTARYYLAGQLVFGIMGAVRNLGEFKTQLGEVDAMAAAANRGGNFQGLGNQLDDVGSKALLMSNKFGIAVTEVEAYMQRFYTAFRPTGSRAQTTKEMEDFVNAHLALVTVLGARAGDPHQLAGGLAALVHQMPGGDKHPGKSAETLSNYFAKIVTSSPQLSGSDIASAAGRLASAKQLSGMSMPELLAAFGLAAHTGGSPAVIIRGMTQLLGQSLMHPTRPASKAVYTQAGLPTDPNALAAMGGEKVLEKLITFTQSGRIPGQKGNRNLDAIYDAFSRQESVRQFVNLLANGGVQGLRNFRQELDKAATDNMAARLAKKRLDQSTLMRMQNARTNLGTSLVMGANWPLEHFVADPVIAASNFAARHRTGTQAVVGGALTLGAMNSLRKLGAFGKLGKFGKFIGAANVAEQAAITQAITKEELPALISGGKADGSRGNPFWVVISPVSWSMGGGAGSGSSPAGVAGDAEKFGGKLFNRVTGGAGILAAAKLFGGRALGRVGGALSGARGLARGAGAIGSALIIQDAIRHPTKYGFDNMGSPHSPHIYGEFGLDHRGVNWSRHPRLGFLTTQGQMAKLGPNFFQTHGSKSALTDIISRFAHRDMSADRAETLLTNAWKNASRSNAIRVDGEAYVIVETVISDIFGHKLGGTKRGVPTKLQSAKPNYPTRQGKPGARKGTGH